jgi:thiol-disulfide isomerase/thioredoxin
MTSPCVLRPAGLILVIFILSACSGKKGETVQQPDIGKIKLLELNGQPFDTGQYEGKTVFINFWATWCKPCLQEMPSIENANNQLRDQRILFLVASNEEPEQIEGFVKNHDYHFHYVRLENLEELNIQALPTTYIFNPEGVLKFSETGLRRWDEPQNIELITHIMNNHEE